MTTTAETASALKSATVTTLVALYGPAVQVVYGDPGTWIAEEFVFVSDVLVSSEISGVVTTSRSGVFDVIVTINEFRGGGVEVQQIATEAAYARLAQLETYLRTTDPTVGGTVMGNAAIIGHLLTEDVTNSGRSAVIEATMRAMAVG